MWKQILDAVLGFFAPLISNVKLLLVVLVVWIVTVAGCNVTGRVAIWRAVRIERVRCMRECECKKKTIFPWRRERAGSIVGAFYGVSSEEVVYPEEDWETLEPEPEPTLAE